MESAAKCFFPGCNNPEGTLVTGKEQRIKNIISASISREGLIHIGLQEDLDNNPNLALQFHKSCVSSYTSKTHIARERKRIGTIDTHDHQQKRRRSEFSSFDFRVHCLICGEKCLSKDSKNPYRWRRVIQCRTREMKNELLTVCDERNDASAEQVRIRINGSLADLHAADAQYHFDCFTQFTGERNVKSASNIATKSEPSACDLAFQHIVNTLRGNASTVWNSVEIYSMYRDHMAATARSSSLADDMCAENVIQARDRKDRSQLVTRLEDHFGPALVIMQVKGCASLICFQKYLPATLKLVEANDSDVVKDMCHKIQAEVQSTSLPKTTAYKLGDFTKDSAVYNCSETLLTLLSSLVSNGKVSKKSLALAQAIQALVSRRFNQTTLGLALQIHLRGEHVCHHRKGVWNAVFLDQFGEQTYIRYGKAKGGLVGKSLSDEQVAEWTLSHPICNAVSLAMDNMFDETEDEDQEDSTGRHKEEGKRRRQLDNEDRKKIILEVERHTNPLLTKATEPLYNIINGLVAADEVNVDQSVSIGGIMAAEFTAKLPDVFYVPLKKTVITMEVMKKKMKVGDSSVYDMEKLYARLLIMSQKRDVELSDLFEYELAPVPTALFDDYGDMRKGSKSVLVSKLAITYKEPPPTVDVQLIDGNEAIYHTLWPKKCNDVYVRQRIHFLIRSSVYQVCSIRLLPGALHQIS